MERTLILQTAQGETVTEAEVCCFARQLLKDLKSDAPKIKWAREANAPWGAFVSTGLHGTSIIRLSTYQHLKHPVIYMSPYEKDWPYDPEQFARIPQYVDVMEPFDYDHLYDYKTPIEHGGFTFTVLHTPGHTPGTSSIFYEDRDADGKVYRVGLHGGMGVNTMVDECFATKEEAERERGAFRAMMEGLKGMPIDITITNHAGNIRMSERMGEDKTDFRPFVDPAFWDAHIDRILDQLTKIEEETCFK